MLRGRLHSDGGAGENPVARRRRAHHRGDFAQLHRDSRMNDRPIGFKRSAHTTNYLRLVDRHVARETPKKRRVSLLTILKRRLAAARKDEGWPANSTGRGGAARGAPARRRLRAGVWGGIGGALGAVGWRDPRLFRASDRARDFSAYADPRRVAVSLSAVAVAGRDRRIADQTPARLRRGRREQELRRPVV